MPRFSIILPTYNRANLLGTAIESVISQDFHDWELFVIDNASTDHTRELVASYNDSRIEYLYTETKGRSLARNIGLDNVKGEWICFLDSDDYYKKQHLSILFESISNYPNYDIHKTGVVFRNSEDTIIFKSKFLNKESLFERFLYQEYASIQETCIRKQHIGTTRFENIEYWEDIHFLIHLSNTNVKQIPCHTVTAMEHSSRSINLAILEHQQINNTLNVMSLYFNKKPHLENAAKNVKDNFISTLVYNGLVSGMSVFRVFLLLKKINRINHPYFFLKTIYYKLFRI